ncbi:MAG: hypothetical protein Q8L45_10995 [Xanthomonadaceae bacterium]|nr:hypothetical protein [Xanthomonadaceae bacterium]
MAPSSDPADQLRRTFVDLTDEMLKHVEQTSMLVAMGWSGAFGWEELLKSWRTVLISEAGSGKTHECRAEQLRLWDAGEPAFYIELAELAKVGLERLLDTRETERLAAWRVSQSDIATFFLDSIDELELTRGSFRTALTQFANAVAGQLHRVRVVITSRPIPFDQHLIRTKLPVPAEPELEREARAEAFADLAMGRNRAASKESTQRQPPDWRSAALMPLSDQQILEMAKRQGVTDADALLAAIQQDNAQDFARRPQDLIELCAGWRERGRIGTHREQVESNITIKLKARTDRPERTTLSVVKAREGATRLALAALLTRKLSIRHSVESDLEGVPGTALDPQAILDDWPDDEIKTLLERALFGFASYGRVRFHHRSVIEFLTAERLHTLSQRGMSIRAVKRMFFADIAYGPRVVKPTMRPVAAWIALKEGMDAIFDEVLDREPEVLFDHGDPRSLSVERRACILRTYVERYGNGSWRGQHIPSLQVRRFAAPQLSDEVLRLWATGIENTEARELLLDIAAIAPIPAMANIAHASAMSGYVPQGERTAAIKLLIRIDDPRLDAISGSMQTELELWPNRLRKSAALSLVPTHVAADRLCHILASITESPETIFDLGWMLSQKIDESTVPTVYLEALRTELTSLVMNGAQWGDQSSHAVSPKPHLVAPLAVVCRHLLVRDQRSSDILTSSVATIRLMRYPYDHGEMITALRKVIADSPTLVRESTFWADDAFLQRFRPNNDPRRRLFDICHDGSITLDPARDHAWVLAALLDPHRMVDERAMVLEAAINGIIPGPEDYSVRLKALKPHVADCPSLLATLDDRLKPRPIDPEYARLNEEFASSQRESERREEESHSSWLQFWDDIARDPVAAFSDDRTRNTVWYLWSTMARVGKHSRAEGWNRRFVELNFGKETADRMRNALMVTWRKDRPTLRSERTPDEKGTYLTRWVLGVAAIAAEAEDPHWACRLLRHEAELAARYVPLELNSFPSWLESLAAAHPDAVDAVLGLELIGELD